MGKTIKKNRDIKDDGKKPSKDKKPVLVIGIHLGKEPLPKKGKK